MAGDRPQPELIPYASHVAHGTGRTPVGIILFAASHLLLGSVLGWFVGSNFRSMSTGHPWVRALVMTLGATSLSMLTGGCALLLKGRAAWLVAVVCFGCLAASQSALAAITAWIISHFYWRGPNRGVLIGGLMFGGTVAVFPLCAILLGYLAGDKARDTFALPPGETNTAVQWLQRAAIAVFLAAVMIGAMMGRAV